MKYSSKSYPKSGISLVNLLTSDPESELDTVAYDQIEVELKAFEEQEKARLGIKEEPVQQWHDANPRTFNRRERESTTLLFGGLTYAHDLLCGAALAGLGYKVRPLDCPDYESLRFGKEFGNRGQCNPTYFTVGNLVKYLVHLRDEVKMTTQEIIAGHVFITAGACGPCRFGTYVTEYRKALRDAGFEGFRVFLFQQQGGLKQAAGDGLGIELNPKFFLTLLQAIIIGDVLNGIGYRIRPYEIEKGATNRAVGECKALLAAAFRSRKSLIVALFRCRQVLKNVAVNRLQPKPKVSIIGEFWAMTTEGDGNYRLQEFLESEGAEVDIQLITYWLYYNLWQHRFDTRRRMMLKEEDDGLHGHKGKNIRKKLIILWAAEKGLRTVFWFYSRLIGLGQLPKVDMDEIATISHQYYDSHLRGGEGHMEVGKLIQMVKKKKNHMVISVKPFGCMPSSGVSDGIQSLITARYPQAIFSAIETTGDGMVNVQSRIQMDLFKARKKAQTEYQDLLDEIGLSQEQAEARLMNRGLHRALYYPRHTVAGTGANALAELI